MSRIVWLSYTTVVETLSALAKGQKTDNPKPSPDDLFVVGCKLDLIGEDPYSGSLGEGHFAPEVLAEAARIIGEAQKAGRVASTKVKPWEALVRTVQVVDRDGADLLFVGIDDKTDYEYCYPAARDALHQIGFRGIF